MIITGFRGPLYYNYNKEPLKQYYGMVSSPYISLMLGA